MSDGTEIQWLGLLARLLREQDTLRNNSLRAVSRSETLGELLREYEEDLERAEETQEKAAAESRSAEREVSRVDDRLATIRRRLDMIRDNDEYRSTLKEIGTVEQELQRCEAELLECYARFEKRKEQTHQANADLLMQEKKITDENGELARSQSGTSDRLADFDDQIARCLKALPLELVSRLKQLTGKLPLPVVWIDNGCCGGCHACLPAQKALSVAAGRCFERCSGCGRLVVAEP